jgi:hypothetical protein
VSEGGAAAVYIQQSNRSSSPLDCASIAIGNAPRMSWLVCSTELVLALQTDPYLVMENFSRPTTELTALPCHRDIMQDMRGHPPCG